MGFSCWKKRPNMYDNDRYPTVAIKIMDAFWEELIEEECGLGPRPYLMTTAASTLIELDWQPEDVKYAVRDFLADPVGTNAVTKEDFLQKMAGAGEPDQQAIRQKTAWPARELEEREDVFEEEQRGNTL